MPSDDRHPGRPDGSSPASAAGLADAAGRVLVTGATGFVGRALCDLLDRQGVRVRAVSRGAGGGDVVPASASAPGRVEAVTAEDVAGEGLYEGCTHVVHLAARAHRTGERPGDAADLYRATNVDLSCRVARAAARGGVRRLLFFSTAGVLGDRSDGTPLADDREPRPATAYAASKLEAEERLTGVCAETGVELVIVRPTLVYGSAVVGNLRRLAGLVLRGLPLPFGLVRNRRSLVSLPSLCELASRLLWHPAASGMRLAAADADAVSTPDIVRAIAGGLGRPARLLPVPAPILRPCLAGLLSPRTASQLLDDLEIAAAEPARRVGWERPTDTADGLRRAAASWRL